jgi:hypothetical protein
MPYGHDSRQAAQSGLIEDVGHQAHAGVEEDTVATGGGDATALLASVLEGEQGKKSEPSHVLLGRIHAEDAAGLVQAHTLISLPVIAFYTLFPRWVNARLLQHNLNWHQFVS